MEGPRPPLSAPLYSTRDLCFQVPLAPPPPGIDLGMITHSKSYTFADGLGSERRSDSVYFTPSGTPQRPSQAHPRSSSLTKDPYKAVYGYSQQQRQQHDNPASSQTAETKPFIKNHGKSKSFSFNFLPSYWFGGGGANVPNRYIICCSENISTAFFTTVMGP